MIPAVNFRYFWDVLVNPRLGSSTHQADAYVWGGSFSAEEVDQGTDCSGAVSAELSAMVRGPGMIYQRQFYTGTFAGARPGDHGPWGGVEDTSSLVCVGQPADAPFGAAMIIAIRQMADPTDAHMICSVPTYIGGPWTTIEMGGPPDNYHLDVTPIDHPQFNQWFYLPGPIEGPPPPPPPLPRPDRYAMAIINEGRRLGITSRGIQIALAVTLVESNLTMYANWNDPSSLELPHDAVSGDHMSAGLFQQQPPWGTLECRMDPSCSATLFYTVDNGPGVRGLTKIRDDDDRLYDYNDSSNSPGFYAQKVQGSAYPDRYDQRWAEAVELYDRLEQTPQEDDMASVPQEEWNEIRDKTRQLWGATFNLIPSKARYGDPEILWATKDFIHNDDGFLYDMVTEHDAILGDKDALERIKKAAAAGDRIARAFLESLENPVTPTPTPMPPAAPPQPVPEPAPTPTNALSAPGTTPPLAAALEEFGRQLAGFKDALNQIIG